MSREYKCSKCGKIVKRNSDKYWIKSYCEQTGITTRIIRQTKKKK